MKKLLIVDDDNSMRGMMRMRLSDSYEVFDTGDPEQALAMALEHKPDAVLMDLMMPKFSGFELCQSFHALSYTASLPIFVITGEAGLKFRDQCGSLGASGYFEKPIDFAKLKERLAHELQDSRPERRSEVRVRMRVPLKLRGLDAESKAFEELAETENVSVSGFLCNCVRLLTKDSFVDVFVAGEKDRHVGRARVVRKESPGVAWQRYGLHFDEPPKDWVLQQ
jgi:DNA-binding response OmpR family regulator